MINSDKIIILYYPPVAGGKFIANCLALSKDVLPFAKEFALLDSNFTDPKECSELIKHDLELEYGNIAGHDWPRLEQFVQHGLPRELRDEEINFSYKLTNIRRLYRNLLSFDTYQQFKLNIALHSLPPVEYVKKWRNFEYYAMLGKTGADSFDCSYYPEIEFAFNSGKYMFLLAHKTEHMLEAKRVWPNAKVLQLINYTNFVNLAVKVKGLPYQPWPNIPLDDSIKFDVDSTITNKDAFIDAMQSLYAQFGLVDFDKDSVLTFYQAYIDLHKKSS